MSTVPSPRSYRRNAEEWGPNATTTQHHARDTLCSSASEAAGLLLEDCAAGALGRAAAWPCSALHMTAACSACHMLLGATGQTSCPWTVGGRVTSTKTAGAGGMSPAVHLCALRTVPSSLRHSRNTL